MRDINSRLRFFPAMHVSDTAGSVVAVTRVETLPKSRQVSMV